MSSLTTSADSTWGWTRIRLLVTVLLKMGTTDVYFCSGFTIIEGEERVLQFGIGV
jgi:hypothetical protein